MVICHLQRGTFHPKIGGSFAISWKGEIAMKGKSEFQNFLITQGLRVYVCTMIKKSMFPSFKQPCSVCLTTNAQEMQQV